MTRYDLCLTWSWEYDADFVRLLEAACGQRGLTVLHITPETLGSLQPGLVEGQITFSAHFDCTAHDARCEPVFAWAREHSIQRINPSELGDWAEDKATMHLELISAGVHTPYTIILSPFNEQPNPPSVDLAPLGLPFVIKPSYGGGGEGVILGASSLEQVLEARRQFPELKYLLQEQIQAHTLDGRRAWFRIIYCAGHFYPCWWDTGTHVYTSVTNAERTHFGLAPLEHITARIAQVCKLDFFSTEIAHTPDGRWVAVDYVNDHIDLRLQSKAPDGVPDAVLADIAADLAGLVESRRPSTGRGLRPRRWFERLFSRRPRRV